MAIYHEDIIDIDLNKATVNRTHANIKTGINDENANRFGVRVFREKKAVDLTGVTCTGYFKKANGETETLTGEVSGNLAYVTLTDDCYTVGREYVLTIKLIEGSVKVTARIVDGNVVTENM